MRAIKINFLLLLLFFRLDFRFLEIKIKYIVAIISGLQNYKSRDFLLFNLYRYILLREIGDNVLFYFIFYRHSNVIGITH